jgi:hypothetical protein
MAKFKNVSPLGALDLPLVGRVVARGEVITVTTAQAKHLKGQADWQPVTGSGTPSGDQEPEQSAPTGDVPAVDQHSEE